MRVRRARLTSGLLIATLLVGSTARADAGSTFSIKLTIFAATAASGYPLRGQVVSRRKSCVSARVVTVYARRAGDSRFVSIGKGTASSSGMWRMRWSRAMLPGTYYASVAAQPNVGGHCQAARSPIVKLDTIKTAVPPPEPEPASPLACESGYLPGRIPGIQREYCLPAQGPPTEADCALGFHVRETYLDQCVPDHPADTEKASE